MKKINIILILLFLISTTLFAQYDKDKLYKDIKDKYQNPKSVSLKFNYKEMNISGSIVAAEGNKYILEISNRIIVSDGTTVWNYDRKKNNVLVNNFESSNSSSLEQFFFEILSKYYPVKLTKENSSEKKSSLVLTLEPTKQSNTVEGVKQIKLWILPKTLEIRSISLITNNDTKTYDILKLEVNMKNVPSFAFTAPKDAKVIDMR